MAEPHPVRFLPSRHGFGFTNSWPEAPAITIPTPFGDIGIGNAAAGLCGGMVFAALDYWHNGTPAPAVQPAPGTPLYRFIVRRLIESWRIPGGVARYYRCMNVPDGDGSPGMAGRLPMTRRGLSWRTIAQEWPRVRTTIDGGQPAALGLVTVASANPVKLGHNHQVLAWGYRLTGTKVTLQVYDPNSGPHDDVAIQFDSSAATLAAQFMHNINIRWPVRGFFVVPYSPAVPPALSALPYATRPDPVPD